MTTTEHWIEYRPDGRWEICERVPDHILGGSVESVIGVYSTVEEVWAKMEELEQTGKGETT